MVVETLSLWISFEVESDKKEWVCGPQKRNSIESWNVSVIPSGMFQKFHWQGQWTKGNRNAPKMWPYSSVFNSSKGMFCGFVGDSKAVLLFQYGTRAYLTNPEILGQEAQKWNIAVLLEKPWIDTGYIYIYVFKTIYTHSFIYIYIYIIRLYYICIEYDYTYFIYLSIDIYDMNIGIYIYIYMYTSFCMVFCCEYLLTS